MPRSAGAGSQLGHHSISLHILNGPNRVGAHRLNGHTHVHFKNKLYATREYVVLTSVMVPNSYRSMGCSARCDDVSTRCDDVSTRCDGVSAKCDGTNN